jgi:hypothetical protein
MPIRASYDREQAADRLGVHPGSPSFDCAWRRLRSGSFADGLSYDREGRLVGASVDADGVYQIHEDDLDTRFEELMLLDPVDPRRPRTVSFSETRGEEWASWWAASEAFGVGLEDGFEDVMYEIEQTSRSGGAPTFKGREVRCIHHYGECRLHVDDARWITSHLIERSGRAPEVNDDWISLGALGSKLAAPYGRRARALATAVFDHIVPQIGKGPDRLIGDVPITAENRSTRTHHVHWRELPYVHVRSLPELLTALHENPGLLPGDPRPKPIPRLDPTGRAPPAASVPTRPASVPTANPIPRAPSPGDVRVRPMDDGHKGRLVLLDGGVPWAVALGRGIGSHQDAMAFRNGMATWLGIDPASGTLCEDALCRPFSAAAEVEDAADFRGSGFLPTTLVIRPEEGDGETRDTYLHGVRGTHAMGGAVSLVGEAVARRELITAWGRSGLGLLALDEGDGRTVSDVARAMEKGRLAVAASSETGPVLILADRVAEGTSLHDVLAVVASAQALNPDARFLRVSEPPPAVTPAPGM